MNQKATTISSKTNIKSIAVTAVFVALTYVFTAFINVTIPPGVEGALVHLGNIPLLIAAIVFGKKTGAIAGGVGMALFDLLSPWAVWAPFTLVVSGLMGFAVGAITEKRRGFGWNLLAVVIACVIKVIGYYIAEGLLYGNWIVPAISIPANILQVAAAGVVILPVVGKIRQAAEKLL